MWRALCHTHWKASSSLHVQTVGLTPTQCRLRPPLPTPICVQSTTSSTSLTWGLCCLQLPPPRTLPAFCFHRRSKSPSAGWHKRFASGACSWTAMDSRHHWRSGALNAHNRSPCQKSQNGQARLYLQDGAALHRQRRCPSPSSWGRRRLPQSTARRRSRRPVEHTQCRSRAMRVPNPKP